MPFKGVTFSGQNVTPKNDGGLYNAHYGDGILWGCSMNISGDDLVIQSGEFIMGGRYVQVDGATNVDLSGRTLQTGYIQVIMNADLTQGEGNQWYPTFVESATTTFPALTMGNINGTDTLYQLELAVLEVSGGNLTSIYKSLLQSSVVVISPDGTIKGRILASDMGSSFMLVDNDETQVSYGGIYIGNDKTTNLFSKSGVFISPNGVNSSSGQVKIQTTGAIQTPNNIVFTGATDQGLYYYNGSTLRGRTLFNAGGYSIETDTYDASNVRKVNMSLKSSGYIDLYASGGFTYRPNSPSDNTNRVAFTTGGVIVAPGVYSTTRSGSTLVIDSSGNIGRTSSLRKYKKNIEDVTEEQANKGYELRPITYQSAIEDDIEERQFGFIAEEVEEVVPELCTYDLDGNVDGVAYERICSLLLKQNQLLKARVDELEKRVEKLEAK